MVMAVLQGRRVVPFGNLGSMPICSLPEAYRSFIVLHRLREPRHPPCALSTFFRPACCSGCPGVRGRRPLILSAVSFSLDSGLKSLVPDSLESDCYFFQFCLCQYVKIFFPDCTLQMHDADGMWPKIRGNNGFEPLTPCLQSRCSNQLS